MSEAALGSVRKGVLLTILLHLLQIIVGPAVFFVSMWLLPNKGNQYGVGSFVLALGGYGITQMIYMIPAIMRFRKRGEQLTVQGLIIGASVTFLICAACDGSLFLPGLMRR